MQPAYAIPPYTPNVEKLVGMRCAVPRQSNPNHVWWGTILECRFISPNTALVKVSGNMNSGKDKWHELKFCRFRKHVDDPLLIAMKRAQAKD